MSNMNLQELKNKNVVLYLLSKSPNKTIDRIKLIKLIWLADRFHLNKYGRKITKSSYVAMPHGPVASEILNFLNRENGVVKRVYNNQIALVEPEDKYLSKSDKEVLDTIWDQLKDHAPMLLRDFSHNFPEWTRFEEFLNDHTMQNSFPMIEEDFFEDNKFFNAVSPDVKSSSIAEYHSKKSFLNSLRS